MNFAMPHTEPFSWDYAIHWYNGSVQNMISFDQSMSANSMSLDYLFGFEAKFLPYDKIKSEVAPANRGNRELYGDCPLHHGCLYTTDMPTSTAGSWILDKREEMIPELIEAIKLTYAEWYAARAALAANPQSGHYARRVKSLEKDLAALRTGFRRGDELISTVFYAEFDPFDNFEILGERFFHDMRRDLPPMLFRTSILNRRPGKVENGFYSSLVPSVHYYTANNNSYLDGLIRSGAHGYDPAAIADECSLHDSDVEPTEPLIIANDYNAAINSLVCGQVQGRTLRTLRSFFVKTPRKLPDVVKDWCAYYRTHRSREVIYYYDATAIYDNPLGGDSFADAVMKVLATAGWKVTPAYIGQPMRHRLKHHYINEALRGNPQYTFPLFNRDNNPYLTFAMEQTGIRPGRNDFEKDKSAERDPDTPEAPDEKKTHITDAWDTLFLGVNFWPTSPSSGGVATSFL
jgi:hypothetical protein